MSFPAQHDHGQQHPSHSNAPFDLARAALDDMHAAGFHPEFAPEVQTQLAEIEASFANPQPAPGIEDLRHLPWSSIDNDTSRDLDQIEVADRVTSSDGTTGIRLRVAIGDVAAAVAQGSPIDRHAQAQTQTIYTAVHNFPMLPLELSTGLTSLNENADRLAVMMTFTVTPAGTLTDESVSLALVRNRAQLAYSRVGPWLEKTAAGVADEDILSLRSDSAREHAPDPGLSPTNLSSRPEPTPNLSSRPKAVPFAATPTNLSSRPEAAHFAAAVERPAAPTAAITPADLVAQLKLQDEAAQLLHTARVAAGALEFHKAEADPVVIDGRVIGLEDATQNRAMNLIEDLMVAANGVMARALRHGGRSGLQRVVVVPKRWDRIVALAQQKGTTLPAEPDSVALNNFLEERRRHDADHYPDLALAVIKLMGPGEYLLMRPTDDPTGHFGLAARDYTHSTAPNRRFPDLVTQRVLHAMARNLPAPYSDADLAAIALHCNDADTKLRKIERTMQKRVAAVAMSHRIGETFPGVVTGASEKGVYVRILRPPFEGRVIQNSEGLDVGDKLQVKLLHTDPARAFIDFARIPGH